MRARLRHLGAAFAVALLGLARAAAQSFTWSITEVNPSQSTLAATQPPTQNSPLGGSGGRVNHLAASADGRIIFAASEWGGLFRSIDAGRTWRHVPGHLPHVTFDVAVDPANPHRIYATSLHDGRASSLSGINDSQNDGATWSRPPSATPPAGFCDGAARREEPEAYGISIDRPNSRTVAVGTNCGVAISNDGGANWRFVDPTPGDAGASDVWDVLAHGGILDTCGADAHRRSTDGGATWTTATSAPLPAGRCSLHVSPDEPYVLFAVVGTTLYESDDGGATWPTTFVNPQPQGRVPFAVANQRADALFDLWFGDRGLWRTSCTTPAPALPGGTPRCPTAAWSASFTRPARGHDDVGDLIFAPVADDACPVLFSSDGGVYLNTLDTSPACHSPAWEQPDVTPHALWLMSMGGSDVANPGAEDLYFGAQDNGAFTATNGPSTPPAWANRQCCDGFDTVGEANRVLVVGCCFPQSTLSMAGVTGTAELTAANNVANMPPGFLQGFRYTDIIRRFAANSYVLVTSAGVFITTNIGATPVAWTQLGAASSPFNPLAVEVAIDTTLAGATPTFFVQTGRSDGQSADRLWRFRGTGAGTWQQVNAPSPGGFGIFAVDPQNSQRIIASDLRPALRSARMVLSVDGGATWTGLPALDNLMTGGGMFRYWNQRGLSHSGNAITGQKGYPQPTLVAFDPASPNTIIAGGADSGVFLSLDSGVTWTLLTDPHRPAVSSRPHIPRPRFAYFDHEGSTFATSRLDIYVGSQGRGVWRIHLDFPLVKADNWCFRHPRACSPVRPLPGKMVVGCQVSRVPGEPISCLARAPLARSCGVAYDCAPVPEGEAGANEYRFVFDGLDPDIWDVAMLSPTGEYVASELSLAPQGVVLHFRPKPGDPKPLALRDYEIVFLRKAGVAARSYTFGTRVETAGLP